MGDRDGLFRPGSEGVFKGLELLQTGQLKGSTIESVDAAGGTPCRTAGKGPALLKAGATFEGRYL